MQNTDVIDVDQSTDGGGTILSNARFIEQTQELGRRYFNSTTGNDKILGSRFKHSIRGGSGVDQIRGGSGADFISGGLGEYSFLYTFDQIDNSHDIIKNFDQSSGDKLIVDTWIDVIVDSGFIVFSYLDFNVRVDLGIDWDSGYIIEYDELTINSS